MTLPALLLLVPLSFLLLFALVPLWILWISLGILIIAISILVIRQDWSRSIYTRLLKAQDRADSLYGRYISKFVNGKVGDAIGIAIIVTVLMLAVDALNQFSLAFMGATMIVTVVAFGAVYIFYDAGLRVIKMASRILGIIDLNVFRLVFLATFVVIICFLLRQLSLAASFADVPFIAGFGIALYYLICSAGLGADEPIISEKNLSDWYRTDGPRIERLARAVIIAVDLSVPVFLLELYLAPGDFRMLTYALFISLSAALYTNTDILKSLWDAFTQRIDKILKIVIPIGYIVGIIALFTIILLITIYSNPYTEAAQLKHTAILIETGTLLLFLLLSIFPKSLFAVGRVIHYIVKGRPKN